MVRSTVICLKGMFAPSGHVASSMGRETCCESDSQDVVVLLGQRVTLCEQILRGKNTESFSCTSLS